MRKLMSIMLTLVLLFTVSPSFAEVDKPIQVKVHDEVVLFPDAQPYLDENNRTMVPVRFVAESLGAEVKWIGESSTIQIKLDNKEILFKIGEKLIKVNGELRQIDTVTVLKDKRTFVPLRFVSEGLGYQVEWSDNVVQIVNSTMAEKPSEVTPGSSKEEKPKLEDIVYVKPTESNIEIIIYDKTKPENADRVDWSVILDARLELAPQHLQTKAFLQERFDNSVVTEIMNYISKKTHYYYDLPSKTIELPGNRIIMISSNAKNPLIQISSFVKNW
jgi:hypothetical protein